MMSQKEKVKELAKKGMKMKGIEQELHVLYVTCSFKPPTIYKYIRETKFSPEALGKHEKPDLTIDFQLVYRIQNVHDEKPFASSYIIADILNETQSIIYICI
jgi:hypothetical protein